MSTSNVGPVDTFLKTNITSDLNDPNRKLSPEEIAKVKAIKDESGQVKFEEDSVPTTLRDLQTDLGQVGVEDLKNYTVATQTALSSKTGRLTIPYNNIPNGSDVILTENSKDASADETSALSGVKRCMCAMNAVLSEKGCYEVTRCINSVFKNTQEGSLSTENFKQDICRSVDAKIPTDLLVQAGDVCRLHFNTVPESRFVCDWSKLSAESTAATVCNGDTINLLTEKINSQVVEVESRVTSWASELAENARELSRMQSENSNLLRKLDTARSTSLNASRTAIKQIESLKASLMKDRE